MIESKHRKIIETFRIALICGCVTREVIIKWADGMVLKQGDYDFIEISMSGKLPLQEFVSLLLKIGLKSDHFNCLRNVLGRMAIIIEQDKTMLRKFAKGLYHFAIENAYELPDDMRFITGLDDEYALAKNGTYGSIDEIDKDFIRDLNNFRNRHSASPDWYSAPPHTSK